MNDVILKTTQAITNQENNFSNHQAGEHIRLGYFGFQHINPLSFGDYQRIALTDFNYIPQ